VEAAQVIHGNIHPVCGGCYIEKVSARLDLVPDPDRIFSGWQRCCRCNRPVSAVLYWKVAPLWMFVPHCPDVEDE
jgi:hypothetical protein